MKQISTSTLPMATTPPPPPPGLTYLAAVNPLLTDVLIGHTFTVIELLLLVALFYFSSSATRRKGVFFLNVLTLSLAIAVGVLADYRSVSYHVSCLHWVLNTVFLDHCHPLSHPQFACFIEHRDWRPWHSPVYIGRHNPPATFNVYLPSYTRWHQSCRTHMRISHAPESPKKR